MVMILMIEKVKDMLIKEVMVETDMLILGGMDTDKCSRIARQDKKTSFIHSVRLRITENVDHCIELNTWL